MRGILLWLSFKIRYKIKRVFTKNAVRHYFTFGIKRLGFISDSEKAQTTVFRVVLGPKMFFMCRYGGYQLSNSGDFRAGKNARALPFDLPVFCRFDVSGDGFQSFERSSLRNQWRSDERQKRRLSVGFPGNFQCPNCFAKCHLQRVASFGNAGNVSLSFYGIFPVAAVSASLLRQMVPWAPGVGKVLPL